MDGQVNTLQNWFVLPLRFSSFMTKPSKTNTLMCQLLLLFIFIDYFQTVYKIIGLRSAQMDQGLRAFTILSEDLAWLPLPISEGSQTSTPQIQEIQYFFLVFMDTCRYMVHIN